VMAMPDVRERLLAAGVEPAQANTPEEFAAFIQKDIAIWKGVAAAAKVTVE
jgi:tripartite-type tricarboxylate transporter receptor subunit TctC